MKVKKPKTEETKRYIGYKIAIYPTKEQIELINEYFGAVRFTYNWCLEKEKEQYEKNKNIVGGKTFIPENDLKTEHFTPLKYKKGYEWLKQYDSSCLKKSLENLITAYEKYFDQNLPNKKPKHKKKKYANQQFAIRKERMSISEKGLEIPGFRSKKPTSNPDMKNTYPIDIKFGDLPKELQRIIGGDGNDKKKNVIYKNYIEPRLVFDGVNYYITFSLEEQTICYKELNELGEMETKDVKVCSNSERKHKYDPEWQAKPTSKPVGIDRGCKRKNWMVDNYDNITIRPDQSKEDQQIAGLLTVLANKIAHNNKRGRKKTNSSYTKNEMKILTRINKYFKKISNRKINEIYNYAKKLVELKPEYVVLEDLSVMDIYESNEKKSSCDDELKKRNKQVKDSVLNEIERIITRVLTNNNIPVIKADKYYPSTQICPKCHHIHNIDKDEIYICPICGYEADRDKNAAENLANYEEGWSEVTLDDEKYIIYPHKKIPLVSFS